MSNLSTPLQIAAPATAGTEGLIKLTGDLGGTYDAPTVAKVNGITISGAPAAAGQVLTASSTSAASWQTPAGSSSAAKRVVTPTWSATITPNSSTTDILRVVLGGTTTLAAPSGTPSDGQQLQVIFVQDGTGGRTVTYNAAYAFSSDIPSPTLSTAANATDVLGFQYSSAASKWRLLGVVKGF